MKRILAALTLVAALIIPVAASAQNAGQCGADPAFGYRTDAGTAATQTILSAAGLGQGSAINPTEAKELPARDLEIVVGSGALGDPVTNPYNLPASAFNSFSGIVGVGDGQSIVYYAIQSGVTVASVPGNGQTDTAALYEKYLGSASPTLAGTPCPVAQVVTIVPPVSPAPSTAVSPEVLNRLRGYIANLTRSGTNPAKLATYEARLADYEAR